MLRKFPSTLQFQNCNILSKIKAINSEQYYNFEIFLIDFLEKLYRVVIPSDVIHEDQANILFFKQISIQYSMSDYGQYTVFLYDFPYHLFTIQTRHVCYPLKPIYKRYCILYHLVKPVLA